MSHEHEQIAERVRKLLALAQSDNEHEAANAAAAAQRLISRHGIDAAMLETGSRDERTSAEDRSTWCKEEVYRGDGPMPSWVVFLSGGVARAGRLKGWTQTGGGTHAYAMAGPREEVEAAGALLRWLAGEVLRLCDQERRGPDCGRGRTYWTSWRNGCATRIAQRVQAAADEERELARREREAPGANEYALAGGDAERLLALDRRAGESTYALARVETALALLERRPDELTGWLAKEHDVKLRDVSRPYGRDAGAFGRGRKAGNRAQISPGRGLPGGGS